MTSENIAFIVNYYEEEVQSFAKDNFGKKLTKKQLNKIKDYWNEGDNGANARYEMLYAVIADANI